MDPISLFITGASLATTIFGSQKASSAANQLYQSQAQVAGLEEQADAQRRQAMELDASRKSMEVLRNSQRARSIALNNATSSGSQFGSGVQGGYGQIEGQTGTNELGISQNLQIGRKEFDINNQINQQRILQAGLQSDVYSGNAIMGLGRSISGALQPLTNLAGNFTGSLFGGGYGSGIGK